MTVALAQFRLVPEMGSLRFSDRLPEQPTIYACKSHAQEIYMGGGYTLKGYSLDGGPEKCGPCDREAMAVAVERLSELIAVYRERWGLDSDSETMERILYEWSDEGAQARIDKALEEYRLRNSIAD